MSIGRVVANFLIYASQYHYHFAFFFFLFFFLRFCFILFLHSFVLSYVRTINIDNFLYKYTNICFWKLFLFAKVCMYFIFKNFGFFFFFFFFSIYYSYIRSILIVILILVWNNSIGAKNIDRKKEKEKPHFLFFIHICKDDDASTL